ncbi:DUF87 domain-containing protein [Candidatus Dependentiae bacterium]|nr:DUF87 domain-containing protein [Candidatus Dependentiae bacterium]
MMFYNKKKKNAFKLAKKQSKKLSYKREIIGILILAFFSFLIISLISHDPKDVSWFYFSTIQQKIVNWGGIIGANISALFFYFFGEAAYILAFLLLYAAFIFLLKRTFRQEWDKFFALSLLLFASSALLQLYNLDFSKNYAGGLVGDFLLNFISKFLGFWGTNILLLAVLTISIVVFFRISIFKVARFLINLAVKFLKFIAKKIFVYCVKIIKFIAEKIKNFFKDIFSKIFSIFKKGGDQGTYVHVGKLSSIFGWHRKNKQEEYNFENNNFDNSQNETAQTEKFWDSLSKLEQDDLQNFEEQNKTESLWAKKQIFNNSYTQKFGNYEFVFLPNTIFEQNIFTNQEICKFLLETEKIKKNIKQKQKKSIPKIEYDLPSLEMFRKTESIDDKSFKKSIENECLKRAEKLEEKLKHFGIKGSVSAVRPGPVITLFEYKPEIDSKISKIVALEDDLALALTAMSIRIVAPIPGRSVVGFEISNQKRQGVFLSDVLISEEFEEFEGELPVNLGVDIVGRPVVEDLVSMPHLLVAGSTGSGKSVGLNAMLAGLLCKLRPDQLKLILIDPKRLEFSPFADIPHLLFPIVTDPRKAAPVLKWLVQEMEKRYDKMAQVGVRNIVEYQKLIKKSDEHENMPFIVLMIDELADLMMVAGKDVEMQIARIAQMARAAGIHMIVATQRPSVDVVTGLIKVNFPSRIAYRVSSKIDSRTIVDCQGAEKLLGKGDLLYMNSASSDLKRIHGAYISEKEIVSLTSHLRSQMQPSYLDLNEELRKVSRQELEDFEDDLYPEIIEFIKDRDEISISQLQRFYKIGFNRSAKIIERLEMDGIIAPAQGSKPRKILRT